MDNGSRRPLGRRLIHGYLQLQKLNVAIGIALLAVAVAAAVVLSLRG
jgi:hypothetical protein